MTQDETNHSRESYTKADHSERSTTWLWRWDAEAYDISLTSGDGRGLEIRFNYVDHESRLCNEAYMKTQRRGFRKLRVGEPGWFHQAMPQTLWGQKLLCSGPPHLIYLFIWLFICILWLQLSGIIRLVFSRVLWLVLRIMEIKADLGNS